MNKNTKKDSNDFRNEQIERLLSAEPQVFKKKQEISRGFFPEELFHVKKQSFSRYQNDFELEIKANSNCFSEYSSVLFENFILNMTMFHHVDGNAIN